MSAFKRRPPSLRYLKARLRPLAQPLLWGPVLVVALGMLALWELSVNPEWLNTEDEVVTASSNPSGNGEISAEDSAIAADIDTSSVLVEELNRSAASSLLNTPNLSNRGFFDDLRAHRLEAAQGKPPAPTSSLAEALNGQPSPNSLLAEGLTNNSLLKPDPTGSELLSTSKPATEESQPTTEASTLSAAIAEPNPTNFTDNLLLPSPLKAAMEKYLEANSPSGDKLKQPEAKASQTTNLPVVPQTATPLSLPFNATPSARTRSGVTSSNSSPDFAPVTFPPTDGSSSPYQTNLSNPKLSAEGTTDLPLPAIPHRQNPAQPLPLLSNPSSLASPGVPSTSSSLGVSTPEPRTSEVGVVPLSNKQVIPSTELNQAVSAPDPLPGRYAGTREFQSTHP
ncbi:MAG: hypothetical protein ACM37W_14660 [Actinomycetota bacterium]